MFEEKYLKYKEKYLALKKLIGGVEQSYNLIKQLEEKRDKKLQSLYDDFTYKTNKVTTNKEGSEKAIALKRIIFDFNEEFAKINEDFDKEIKPYLSPNSA